VVARGRGRVREVRLCLREEGGGGGGAAERYLPSECGEQEHALLVAVADLDELLDGARALLVGGDRGQVLLQREQQPEAVRAAGDVEEALEEVVAE
jgi:hypothetical protein